MSLSAVALGVHRDICVRVCAAHATACGGGQIQIGRVPFSIYLQENKCYTPEILMWLQTLGSLDWLVSLLADTSVTIECAN